MVSTVSNTTTRTEMQCERILNAAEACFIKFGFHAASMSNICEAAGMSPGLVYRYFDNKSTIIKSIINRQLERSLMDIAELLAGTDLVTIIMSFFSDKGSESRKPINPALYLELIAEATRNGDIRAAVESSDAVSRNGLRSWLQKLADDRGAEPSDEELNINTFTIQCFLDGLAIRAARDPDLDPAIIEAGIRRFLPPLLAS
jgi:AcrR family transcriptional regulator